MTWNVEDLHKVDELHYSLEVVIIHLKITVPIRYFEDTKGSLTDAY